MVFAIALPMTLAFLTTPLLGLVDTAVVGRLGDAALIGGLAVGAMLFDIVFTAFNFLRSSTTGLAAQAMGREDWVEQQAIFWRALITSAVVGALVVVASPVLIWAGLIFMSPGENVGAAAQTYLAIRVLSAPVALANYVVLGFVLGQGRSGLGLLLQTVIYGTNIVLSILFGLYLGWGLPGVAWATVISEIIGCAAGLLIVISGFRAVARPAWSKILDAAALKRLLSLNTDIMIRSLGLMFAFVWFTRLGAALGELQLAANAILMNVFMVASYYLDGLANAAEQIVGRAVGANHRPAFIRAIKLTTLWSFVCAGVTTLLFLVFGDRVITMLTTVPEVRELASVYLPWAALTALTGALAFEMDGVFIGATWSRDMRNMMLIVLPFFVLAAHFLGQAFGNHGLWAALNIFLAGRGVFLMIVLPRRTRETFVACHAGSERLA
ncbi:MATE family efflux transporter [Pseudohoeflea suaedae]|uniref:MATE family efflux transporter n=2 Tax=Pseudohoeflea suaedae TaxID=877384 RepID=A0A4R5PSE8_9HYPH|nr:MATE family efflux transporter [Pseudohoeflea suaedae]TDH39407.1 MATE family efflux transporter [Pseudohoeflea suaedae]